MTRRVTQIKIALKAELHMPLLRTVTSGLLLLMPFKLRGVAGVESQELLETGAIHPYSPRARSVQG